MLKVLLDKIHFSSVTVAILKQFKNSQQIFNILNCFIFLGYQHFEFSVVPELTEESSRLAKQTKEMDGKPLEGDADKEDTDKDGYVKVF